MIYNEFRGVVGEILENNGVEIVNPNIPHERVVWLINKFACEDFRQFFGIGPDEICFDNADVSGEERMYYRVGFDEYKQLDHARCLDLALFGCYGRLTVEVNKWESVTFETTKKKIHEFLKLVGVAKA